MIRRDDENEKRPALRVIAGSKTVEKQWWEYPQLSIIAAHAERIAIGLDPSKTRLAAELVIGKGRRDFTGHGRHEVEALIVAYMKGERSKLQALCRAAELEVGSFTSRGVGYIVDTINFADHPGSAFPDFSVREWKGLMDEQVKRMRKKLDPPKNLAFLSVVRWGCRGTAAAVGASATRAKRRGCCEGGKRRPLTGGLAEKAAPEVPTVSSAGYTWHNLERITADLLAMMQSADLGQAEDEAKRLDDALRLGVPSNAHGVAKGIREILAVTNVLEPGARRARMRELSTLDKITLQTALVKLLRVACHRGE